MDTREEWLRELNPTQLDIELEKADRKECEYCGDTLIDHPEAENNKCFLDVDAVMYFCGKCEEHHLSLFEEGEEKNIKVVFTN